MNHAKTLSSCEENKEYEIFEIDTGSDIEMENFLFTLGCYKGQKITVISNLNKNYVMLVKDARYSIDEELANTIIVV